MYPHSLLIFMRKHVPMLQNANGLTRMLFYYYLNAIIIVRHVIHPMTEQNAANVLYTMVFSICLAIQPATAHVHLLTTNRILLIVFHALPLVNNALLLVQIVRHVSTITYFSQITILASLNALIIITIVMTQTSVNLAIHYVKNALIIRHLASSVLRMFTGCHIMIPVG